MPPLDSTQPPLYGQYSTGAAYSGQGPWGVYPGPLAPPPLPQRARRGDKRMDPRDLLALIRRELNISIGEQNGRLSIERQEAVKYYQGEEFANPAPGQNRSKVVMRTVLETVEWVLPALLRIFTASDHIARIEPLAQPAPPPQMPGQPPPLDPVEAAQQAEDYVNYVFGRENPGFMLLHDWFKDALLLKSGWVKRWYHEEETRETNSFTGLTQAEYAAKLGDPSGEVEILEERSYPAPLMNQFLLDAPNPAPPGAMLYDCKLRVTRKQGRIRIENVPPEEIRFSRRAKRDYIPYLCHKRQWTITDLIEQGFDEDKLLEIGQADTEDYNPERLQRYRPDDDFPYSMDRTDPPMRVIWVEEHYVYADWDLDGKAELLKVTTANSAMQLLYKNGEPDIEEIDEHPLVQICPVPTPHKLVGMSVADLVMDLQRIKSTLMRQMLDNIYLTNNPRHLVVESAATDETYDDLLTSKPGGIVRAKTGDGVTPLVTPFVAEKAMLLVEYVDQTAEVRTGISRHNQGLDPEALNKTATGVNLIQQAAQQRVELIARIFAFGVKQLVEGILGLIKKHQQQEKIIRVTGSWLKLDPRQWKNDMEVQVSVGLGTGNRDQILGHLMQLLQVQNQIVQVQGGVSGPLVYAKNVYDVVNRLTENAGFKEQFFADPSMPPPPGTPPPQQHGGDPVAAQQMQLVQAQAQAETQLMQQKAQLQAQLQQQKADTEAKLDQQRVNHDAAIDQMKAQHDWTLQQQRMQHDFMLERIKTDNDITLARIKAEHQAGVAHHKIATEAAMQKVDVE